MIAVVQPRPGDALDTHIEACAAANGTTLHHYAEHLGILNGTNRFPALWGAVISERHADRLLDVLGIDAAAMTLSRYHPNAINLDGLDPDRPTTMRTVLRRQWLHIAGSRYCPDCLRAGGQWQIAWKLPWTFACTVHRVWMRDTCPACARRPRTYDDKSVTQPMFSTVVPDLSRCPNRARTGHTNVGRAGAPCGTDLAQVTSTRCPAKILATQRTINRWLESPTAELLGDTLDTRAAFHTLQAVCVWLDAASHESSGTRPWLTPPPHATDVGDRVQRAVVALRSDPETAADQLARPLAPLLQGTASARVTLRERAARHPLSDQLADLIGSHFERTSTRLRRRATQLLLPLSGTTIEELIAAIDSNIDFDALRDLTGVNNQTRILRDAVIIDAVIAAGAKTAAHAADLANLEPGAVKRHSYARHLINRAENRMPWLEHVDRLADAGSVQPHPNQVAGNETFSTVTPGPRATRELT